MGKFRCLFFFVLASLSAQSQEITHEHDVYHAFIENKGQWQPEVLFKAKVPTGNLWVQQRKMVFHLQDHSVMKALHGKPRDNGPQAAIPQTVVHLNFPGANEVQHIDKFIPSSYYYNFFKGNDPSKWQSNVRGYSEAILHEFYNGIDLKLIEEHAQLKYEFHVRPKVSAQVIRFNYAGQEKVHLDNKGNLVVSTALGQIIEQKPYAYQIINGSIRNVECAFQFVGNEVSFQLGNYDQNAILVIDPVLVFATYSGSVTDNFGMTATYGYDGTAYSAGTVFGNAYPTPDNNAFDVNSNFTVPSNTSYGITDVFVSKYTSDGTNMIWTTFLGGGDDLQGTETAHSLICDKLNNLYIYGATSSTDFPIVNGYQSAHGGGVANANFYFNGVYFSNQGTDIYVAKLSANGQNLMASTYMGGTENDGINTKVSSGIYSSVAAYDSLTSNYGDQFRGEIMLDPAGNCLIASCSRSTDFPVLNAFQANNAGMQDGVLFKLTPNLSNLVWSSYYGGTNNDACYSVKIDSSSNIVFSGGTSSQNLPFTAGGWQSAYNGGMTDGFVVKLNPAATAVINGSYIGTPNYDQAFFVEIDRNDNVFLLGQSAGGAFPVNNAAFVNANSSQFVMKMNPSLTAVLNSTVFGNGGAATNISPSAFLVDICGNLYISGWGANILQGTPLSGMPVSPNAFQQNPGNGFDFYLLVIERGFDAMLYGTYLGGNQAQEHVDGGTSRFDKNGVVYQSVCGGCGGHSDFPTTPGAWSNLNLSSNCNNIVFKFDFQLIPNAEFSADQTLGCADFTVTLDNFSTQSDSYLWDFGNGDTSTVIFNPTITYTQPGDYLVYLYVTDSVCLLTDTAQIAITVTDAIQLQVQNDVELCSPVQMTFIANSFGTATYFIWSESSDLSNPLNAPQDSVITYMPSGSTVLYVMAGNDGCYQKDSVVVTFVSSSLSLSANDSICAGETAIVTAVSLDPSIQFTYDWGPDPILTPPGTGASVGFKPTTTQYVYVTASASNGCVISDSILIAVSSIANGSVIASANPTLVPEGGQTTLSGQPSGMTYTWTPALGVTNPTMQSTLATVDQTTIYTLSVSDGICTKSDTALVKTFAFICGEPYVFVPNAFTPNGDNENDVLYVRGIMIEGMVFRVFDRWGEMVFESLDRDFGWDGTFRGKALDPDVYDYYLKAVCIDGNESIIKGNISLMK